MFYNVTNILINVADYSGFSLKKTKQNKNNVSCKHNVNVEGPYGTLSPDFFTFILMCSSREGENCQCNKNNLFLFIFC